jgi:hypothetical protein
MLHEGSPGDPWWWGGMLAFGRTRLAPTLPSRALA